MPGCSNRQSLPLNVLGRRRFGLLDLLVFWGKIMKENQEIIRMLSSSTFLLGFAHGAIQEILNSQENTWRPALLALSEHLAKDINRLYYGNNQD